jgi:hypothetical protein
VGWAALQPKKYLVLHNLPYLNISVPNRDVRACMGKGVCRKWRDDGTYVCKLLQIDALPHLINIIYSDVVYQPV